MAAEPAVEDNETADESIEERLDRLEEALDEERQKRIEAEQERDALRERVAELESQPDFEWNSRDLEDFSVTSKKGVTVPLGQIVKSKVSEVAVEEMVDEDIKPDIDETLEEVQERLQQEQKTRTHHDSLIERKVACIADECEIDLSDTAIAGEDKIKRLLKHGPDDITDRVYPVHHRARDTLSHAADWGTSTQDSFGERITLKGPKVRRQLELKRDESLQSKQVRDVFEKIEELGQDSPRTVTAKTGGDGVNKLTIYLEEDGGS
jgi:hypothetical protein